MHLGLLVDACTKKCRLCSCDESSSLWGQGATNVVLDGVYHSMSQIGSFSEPLQHVWYGSEAVVDHWLQYVVTNPVSEVSQVQM